MTTQISLKAALLVMVLLLSACGGGGSGGGAPEGSEGSQSQEETNGNQAPVAVVAFSIATSSGNYTVTLDGASSYDSDGMISQYAWQQLTGPTVDITNSSLDTAHFQFPLVDAPTHFEFSLNVTDNEGLSHVQTVTLSLQPILEGYTNLVGPVSIGFVETSQSAENVVVHGSYAYVADGENGVQIVDISSPRSPQIVSFVDTLDRALDIAVADNGQTLFIGDARSLYSVDISTPATPEILQTIDDDRFRTTSMSLEGDYLYIANYEGLTVVDVSNPSAMAFRGEYELTGHLYVPDIQVIGDTAYLANGGLTILDVSNPLGITLLGSMNSSASRVFVANDIAYLAAGSDGVRAIRVADPTVLQEINVFEANHDLIRDREVDSLFIDGDTAYIGAGGTFQVWNIEDIAAPVLLGQTKSRTSTRGIQVHNGLAYVVGNNGLEVIDVTDPVSLVSLDNFIREVDEISAEAIANNDTILDNGRAYDVFDREDVTFVTTPAWTLSTVADGLLYGLNGEILYGAQLTITDVSNPNNLVELSATTLPAIAAFPANQFYNFVVVDNDRLLASYTNGHAYLIDVSNSFNPSAEHIDLAQYGYPNIIGFNADIIYAVASDGALALVDISDRNNPLELSRTTINEDFYIAPQRAIVDGDVLYVTTAFAFHIYDMQTPTAPVWLNSIPFDFTNKMQKKDDLIFIALGQSGSGSIAVIDVAIPASPAVTYLETGFKTVQSVIANEDTVIFQGYDVAATRVHDISRYLD